MPALVAPTVPRRVVVVVALVVGLLGAAVRLHMLLRPSPLFFGVYDDGVHFSAAVNLVHGHWPYRDVLFLQPPGVIAAASPFALLANVVGDAHAFEAGRIAFALIGAANGALVAVALRRFGVGAMVVGGALYALSFAAAYDERTITLEVIGTTGVLCSLVLLEVAANRRRRVLFLLAGAAAGVSIDFKIWYVVPFVVLAVVAWRHAAPFVLGGVLAGLAGYLPFFLVAPAQMWQQVVVAQLVRPALTGSPLGERMRSMLGIDGGAPGRIPELVGPTLQTVLVVLVVVLALLALGARGARRFVALLVACAVVLLASPSYFQHYAVLTAAPLALVAGAGTAELARRLGGRPSVLAISVAVALALQLGVSASQDLQRSNQKVAPIAALRAASARIPGCLVADDPTILILMDRLTPDVRAGCVVRSDPSGYGYVLTNAAGQHVSRTRNPVWQRNALTYLRSADAYLLVRGAMFGLTPASRAVVEGDRVLLEHGRFTIRTAR